MRLYDFIIFEHRAIFKQLFWICLIICIPVVFTGSCFGYLQQLDQQYTDGDTPQQPAGTVNPSANGYSPTSKPTIAIQLDPITIDIDALKRNSQYPTTFTRDKNKDPLGAYFADLNFGTGPFPGVYINPDTWQKAGGRIVTVNQMPVSGFYYTVFTHAGTSTQVIYDRQRNVVYTMTDNPEVMK